VGFRGDFGRCGEEKNYLLVPGIETHPLGYRHSLYQPSYLNSLYLYGSGYVTGLDFREHGNVFSVLMKDGQ
jgi:hypothetical protein